MANSWLRLYHDMPNDPKWRTIARASKQTIPVVLAVYVHLLTIASGAVERGVLINVNSEDLASALDVDCEEVDEVLKAMQGRVLEGAKLSGWDKRQVAREDGAAERSKAWRERKRTDANAGERKRAADKKREEEINNKANTLASTAVAVPAKLVCTLPLNDDSEHEVFDVDVQQWQELYLAVDVRQQLRNLKGWLMGNPKLRKTKSGINRFINSWMSRAQNDAKPTGGSNENRNHGKTAGNLDALAEAERFARERYSETADDFGGAPSGPADTGYASDFLEGSGKLLLEGH